MNNKEYILDTTKTLFQTLANMGVTYEEEDLTFDIIENHITEVVKKLTLTDVVKSLPSRDDAVNYAANKLFDDEDVEYQTVLIKPKESGYMTGFLDCHKWLTK